LTCKNRLPYNLYCVGGDVKHCTIQSVLFIALRLRFVRLAWQRLCFQSTGVCTVTYSASAANYFLKGRSHSAPHRRFRTIPEGPAWHRNVRYRPEPCVTAFGVS